MRTTLYGFTVVLLAAATVLGAFAPPCDIIDGPCSENWASDPAWAAVIALFFLIPVVLAFGAFDITRAVAARRRRRRSS